MIARFNNNEHDITLFGGIKGLVRDGDDLKSALYQERPGAIYIVLSKEQIDGLSAFLKDPFELSMSDYEISYGLHLSVYGEVMTPPPIYIEAVKYAEENGKELRPLDVPEKEYSEFYVKNVKMFDLLRNSLRKRRVTRMEFGDTSPEDFVRRWEETMNRVKGLKRVEDYRLSYIEERIREYLSSEKEKNVFIITEFEFYDQLKKFLSDGMNR
ncbi:hypothetical protein [Thermoplasma acidophilum]|uniref:Uncharacterized protein n=1 Tax=Thermoplasma acidophilum (strain ATCC 25905 / DSM 1728 / JCM 9062 / NBRC 15155 / AMRC-C165) TaxID=273075 RepID=Q9HIH5_THEAC|nr:hypothetical protein [Thermoplasma acidophilum]CAC12485.1 hypothetical protein [Thermoplasma acidophilum]